MTYTKEDVKQYQENLITLHKACDIATKGKMSPLDPSKVREFFERVEAEVKPKKD